MAKSKGQEHSRIGVIMRDQHDREWEATLEKETMVPTAVVSPRFTAPFYPDQKYMRFGGKNNPVQLTIDYEAMERDLQDAHEDYDRTLRQMAIKQYGQKAAEALKDPPMELLEVLGPRPDPLEPVWAASEGNRFVLGFTDAMPEWARPFFERKVEEKRLARERSAVRFPDVDEEGEYADEEEGELVGAGAGAEKAPSKRKK